jgi:hypothetical protein
MRLLLTALACLMAFACSEAADSLETSVSCDSPFEFGPATRIEAMALVIDESGEPARQLRLQFDAMPAGSDALVAFDTGSLEWTKYEQESRTMLIPVREGFQGPVTYGTVSFDSTILPRPLQTGYEIVGDEVRCQR